MTDSLTPTTEIARYLDAATVSLCDSIARATRTYPRLRDVEPLNHRRPESAGAWREVSVIFYFDGCEYFVLHRRANYPWKLQPCLRPWTSARLLLGTARVIDPMRSDASIAATVQRWWTSRLIPWRSRMLSLL